MYSYEGNCVFVVSAYSLGTIQIKVPTPFHCALLLPAAADNDDDSVMNISRHLINRFDNNREIFMQWLSGFVAMNK